MKEQKASLKDLRIEGSWTLFLDRDGVINHRIEGDYVREWAQFRFLPKAKAALRILSNIFGRVIVVTNQRGIARGFLTRAALVHIHERMISEIRRSGGRIDGIYFCPHDLNTHCKCRKPGTGLAFKAMRDFPSIILSKSIMVGDDYSDIVFAKKLNMKSVMIGNINKNEPLEGMADFRFKDLYRFASAL